MPRLLACRTCGTMYKMRDYEGNADYDMELQELINRHLGQAEDRNPESHLSLIFRVDESTWEKLGDETSVQKELLKNEWVVRELRDDLKVEALRCFNRHNRPANGCMDYEDESKTIGRKVGIPKENRQYLCHYCPAQEHVTHKKRLAKGMYDG
jgi:hypothetical protein